MSLDLPPAEEPIPARSSVIFAICQVRFEETPSVSDKMTAVTFHERLGSADGPYPQINRAEIASGITMSFGPAGPATETKRTSGWRMVADEGAWLVGLFPGHVALQTQQYAGWDDFAERLALVLESVVAVVEPAFAQRIALRFTDRLSGLGVESAAGWEPYITPQFLGPVLLPGLGPSVRGAEQHLVIDIGEGVSCNLTHASTDPAEGTCDYIFDCDLYREGSHPFDIGAIQMVVSTFKDHADRLFGAAVTPAFLERLRQ
jgi:uncharacterized protein (TIGR04255 family)